MSFPEIEQAVAFYQQGYTCAQSILASFSERYGFPQSLAFKLGEPFGAGMSCTNDLCGCISGAVMVLGLHYGSTRSNDDAARSYTYQHAQELIGDPASKHTAVEMVMTEKGNEIAYNAISSFASGTQNKALYLMIASGVVIVGTIAWTVIQSRRGRAPSK